MPSLLKQKIRRKQARVAVIGLGYVGLPLALSFARKGFKVIGIDTNAQRVQRIRRLQSYISDVSSREISAVVKAGRFEVSTDVALLACADAIIICVPTPIKRKYTPDVSYMVGAVKSVARFIKRGTLVVLESTTYPGTTEELIKPELEKSGLKAGRDFYVAFSPERIDPGSSFHVTAIPKVVGGLTPTCTEMAAALYGQVIKKIHTVSSSQAAEMTKLLENSFRIVNIGWINEIAQTCHRLNIDVWEVIEAAKTKPFGFMPFYPGLGVGGHCIPEDPLYLYWKAKRYGFNSKFIKLAADTNAHMPNYAVHRLQEMLAPKALEKSKILVLGVTYKKDVKDLRKSPSIRLVELLKSRCQVDFYDPLVPYLKVGGLDIQGVELTPTNLKKYDCVVVSVDHSQVNYGLLRRYAKKIFDVRNVYAGVSDRKIVKL